MMIWAPVGRRSKCGRTTIRSSTRPRSSSRCPQFSPPPLQISFLDLQNSWFFPFLNRFLLPPNFYVFHNSELDKAPLVQQVLSTLSHTVYSFIIFRSQLSSRRCSQLYLTQYIYLFVLESQLPHRIVNLIFRFIIGNIRLTILWDSWLSSTNQ